MGHWGIGHWALGLVVPLVRVPLCLTLREAKAISSLVFLFNFEF